MKHISVLYSVFLASCVNNSSSPQQDVQALATTNSAQLSVVNWNIDWFGSSRNGPANKDLQRQNVQQVVSKLNADVLAFCEVVDTASFGNMIRAVNPNYQYVISPFCAPNSNKWLDGQKMALVFDASKLQYRSSRALLQGSSRASYNFSNGRVPFLIQMQSGNVDLNFIIIHAKAGNDYNSYQRRADAAKELADTLSVKFEKIPTILLGDFNDAIPQSITNHQVSPYQSLLDQGFTALTSQTALPNEASTIDYDNVIDQQLENGAWKNVFGKNTTKVVHDVTSWVANYTKGNTSDHYPVYSIFERGGAIATAESNKKTSENTPIQKRKIPTVATNEEVSSAFAIEEKTFGDKIYLTVKENKSNVNFSILDAHNKESLHFYKKSLYKGVFPIRVGKLASGTYRLQIQTDNEKTIFSIQKQ